MSSFDFLVSLIGKKGNFLKRPKQKVISCLSDFTLKDLHNDILTSFRLSDDHYYAFYFAGEPYQYLEAEWGGEGSLFANPAELMFRTILHNVLNNQNISSEDVPEHITSYVDGLMESQGQSVDLLPMNDASTKLIADCDFHIHDSFLYVYDFGDSFIFSVEVLSLADTSQSSASSGNLRSNDFDAFVDSLKELLSETPNTDSKKVTKKNKKKILTTTIAELDVSPQVISPPVKKKKSKSKSKTSNYDLLFRKKPYQEKIDELLSNVSTSYPDQFIDEIISLNDSKFAIDLLKYFNGDLRDYSPEFLLKCFFSSTKAYDQLCSLFLNQIQLFDWHADNLFSSFLEFSGSLYLKNKPKYVLTLKNLSLFTLLLCLDCFDSDSLEKFLFYSNNVLLVEDFQQMAKSLYTANKLNNLQNIIQIYLQIIPEDSDIDEDSIYFHRTSVYSKISQKSLLYLLFSVFPEIISPVVHFMLDPSVANNRSITNWILPIIELIAEHCDLFDFSDIVESIATKTNYGEATSKLIVGITCWSITDNLQFIRDLKTLKATRVQTKIKKLLKDPTAYRIYLIHNRVKYWSRIQSLNDDYSHLKDENNLNQDPKSIFIFEITLKGRKIVRTVAIEGKSSLDSLHLCIQDFFDFDNDHLYGFFLDNKNSRWSDNAFLSPHDEEGPSAKKKLIYQCNFFIGMKFLYIFDFGDNWRFQIKVKDIRSKLQEEKEFPYLISQKGSSPEQYPDYDDS